MLQDVRKFLAADTRQLQTNNIVMITFWSQFAVYALNTVLVLFLTRPLLAHGLGYSDAKAYAFIGISQATGYLMPVLGGFMADQVVGVRRSILLGGFMLASAYLLVMLSGYSIGHGDTLFIAAYALVPATNSLLMGTASSLVAKIYSDDVIKAKSAMTFYYMAINVGALLATFLAPALLDSAYGPLSVLTVAFVGKAIAALNFARRYSLYDNVIWGKDASPMSSSARLKLAGYIAGIYLFTLTAYSHVNVASIVVSLGCGLGILWFLIQTLRLRGSKRVKQLIALLLIIEAVIFFIIYNQMNTTLVIFANTNSTLSLLGFKISPAHYQMLNPLLIIALGIQLPKFYEKFPQFSIPYQFAAGTILAGLSLLIMAFAAAHAPNGYVNGNYIALTYVLITLAELWVSAIGLSMIGIYCDNKNIAFAMGVWYLACSLSNTISGQLAGFIVIPKHLSAASLSIHIYQHYYVMLGCFALITGIIMWAGAMFIQKQLGRRLIS